MPTGLFYRPGDRDVNANIKHKIPRVLEDRYWCLSVWNYLLVSERWQENILGTFREPQRRSTNGRCDPLLPAVTLDPLHRPGRQGLQTRRSIPGRRLYTRQLRGSKLHVKHSPVSSAEDEVVGLLLAPLSSTGSVFSTYKQADYSKSNCVELALIIWIITCHMLGCSPIFQPCWHVPILAGCHSLPHLCLSSHPPAFSTSSWATERSEGSGAAGPCPTVLLESCSGNICLLWVTVSVGIYAQGIKPDLIA